MLAYFGALRPNPWQCADAVRAELGDAFPLAAMPPEPVHGIAEPVQTWAVR